MHPLIPHPAAPAYWLDSAAVDLAWDDNGELRLDYYLRGALDWLKLPNTETAEHRDGLWRHTCCEAFVEGDDGPAYCEYNLSPGGAWAAYRFEDYREAGVRLAIGEPEIACACSNNQLRVSATLDAASLPPGRHLHLGLAMVVESIEGELSYWALAHPAEHPDFHAADSFLLELQRP